MIEGKITICISAKVTDAGVLEIRIQDNGVGFDVQDTEEMHKDSRRFHSIGINNVSERIKMYYGDSYGVQIQSRYGEGTLVILTQPLIESNE